MGYTEKTTHLYLSKNRMLTFTIGYCLTFYVSSVVSTEFILLFVTDSPQTMILRVTFLCTGQLVEIFLGTMSKANTTRQVEKKMPGL